MKDPIQHKQTSYDIRRLLGSVGKPLGIPAPGVDPHLWRSGYIVPIARALIEVNPEWKENQPISQAGELSFAKSGR